MNLSLVLKTIVSSTLFLGLNVSFLKSAKAQVSNETKVNPTRIDDSQPINETGLVEIEPTNIMTSDLTGEFIMVPYRMRREKWGSHFGISFSTYYPESYEPHFFTADYTAVYGDNPVGMTELHLTVKRNFSWGSLGGEVGVGTYSANGKNNTDLSLDFSGSSLSLTPVRLGLQYVMDTLWLEPYVAPYISAGLYTIIYEETLASVEFGGNSQVSPYVSAGGLFQLDWLDPTGARESYQESGIENTFLFLEARMFFVSEKVSDPDFSGVHFNAGLKVEF